MGKKSETPEITTRTYVKQRATKITRPIFVHSFACVISIAENPAIIKDSTQSKKFPDNSSSASTFQCFCSLGRMLQKTLAQICFVYFQLHVNQVGTSSCMNCTEFMIAETAEIHETHRNCKCSR